MNPMDITKFEKLKVSGNLPSPKGVALAIMRLMQREDASMAEAARIVKSDPAFVGRLIKAANTVHVNPGRPVVSIDEALVVLGMTAVRNLALGFSLLSQYKQGACKRFDYMKFWSSSLACGIAYQNLALHTRAAQSEEAFSVGLLARIGELAMATLFSEEFGAILVLMSENPQADQIALETERFAMNHRELTSAMLRDWGLPASYCDIVEWHERSEEPPFPEESRLGILLLSLALSRLIAEVCTAAGDEERAALMPRLQALGGRLGLDEEALASLCEHIMREWTDWAAILEVDTCKVSSLEEVARRSEAPPAEAAPAENPASLRVLVAEEDGALRALLRATLVKGGYAVMEAAGGEEALRVALDSEPHMMVAGGLAAPMDGVELTRVLRKTRLGRAMYILRLTTHGQNNLVEGFEAGIDDYLVATPLNQRLLLARMGAGQRIVRLHQELEREREELRRFAADLAVSNRRLEEAALTDVLTGFPNRRYAMDRMEQEWAASSRSKRPFACMVIDLDRFKQINDSCGHDAGDAYLKQVAQSIRNALRVQDVVCRTGGDEFLIICPDTGLEVALACAERVRQAVEQTPVVFNGRRLKATLSVGVAVREEAMANIDALIKSADEGVYLAKNRGSNRIATSEPRQAIDPEDLFSEMPPPLKFLAEVSSTR